MLVKARLRQRPAALALYAIYLLTPLCSLAVFATSLEVFDLVFPDVSRWLNIYHLLIIQ